MNSEDFHRDFGRLESKVDRLLDTQKEFMTKFEKHDDRLKGLEVYRSYLIGIVAVVGILISVAVDFVKYRILGLS